MLGDMARGGERRTTRATSPSIGKYRHPADHRPPDPDRRRRACRSGTGLGRGEDHAGRMTSTTSKSASAHGIEPPTCSTCFDAEAQVDADCRWADPGRVSSAWTGSTRARRSSRDEGDGCSMPHVDKDGESSTTPNRAPSRRPLATARGVVIEPWLTDQWYVERRRRWPSRRSRRCARARSRSCPRPGKRPTSTGWRTSSRGACRGSCGGGTGFRRGMHDDGSCLRRRDRGRGAGAGRRRRRADAATRTCSTPGSPRRCGRSPRSAGRNRRRELASAITPTTCWSSGFDILFFWDARMMMQGIHFMDGERRGRRSISTASSATPMGAKMSKSKGNIVDPLGLIDKYGADALRFFMAAMESQGRDIKMDEKPRRRLPQLRHQAVERGALLPVERHRRHRTAIAAAGRDPPVNRWIIGEVVETARRARQGHGRACASTPQPTRSTTSSGTSSATGISN